MVRSKVESSAEVLAARQALVESKTPLELSKMHSLSEVPIPSRVEAWLSGAPAVEQLEGCVQDPVARPPPLTH